MDVTHSTLYVSKKPQTGLLRLLLCVPAFWANPYKRSYRSSSLTNKIETFSFPFKLCSYAIICIFTDHSEGLYSNQTKCVELPSQKNVNWTNETLCIWNPYMHKNGSIRDQVGTSPNIARPHYVSMEFTLSCVYPVLGMRSSARDWTFWDTRYSMGNQEKL